jgi:hypothetical protein
VRSGQLIFRQLPLAKGPLGRFSDGPSHSPGV